MSSPTQRSKKHLSDDGWTVAIVERWNPHARIRQDLFGFADLIAMKPGHTPRLIQVTSGGWTDRIKKILGLELAAQALDAGFEIHVHGWRKLKSNRNRWTIKEVQVFKEDFLKCHTTPCD